MINVLVIGLIKTEQIYVPKIQNEMLETMGLKVLREISLDVCSAPFFL